MSGNYYPRSILLLLCGLAAALAPAPVHAQDFATGQVRWRTDYNFARREALEKKLPIFIDFYMNPCKYCDLMDANAFQDANVVKLLNERFIPLKIYKNNPANDELIDKLFVRSFPTFILATHDGKILTSPAIVGYQDPAVLYDRLLRVLGSMSDPEWMVQNQQQALKFYQAKDYARAVALLRTVIEDGKARPIQVAARKMLHDLEDAGQARLTQARELLKNRNTAEAIEIANDTQRNFTGLQAARDAGGLLAEMMQSSELRGQQRGKKAQELLAQAQEAYKSKEYFICFDRCETLVKGFGDLPEAQEAYLISANIKSDPQFLLNAGKVLEERLGEVWLAQGESHLRAGQPEQARYYFERVLRAFPGTRHADFAQIRLGQFTSANGRGVPAMTPQVPH